jgi:DNA-binding SARP family transcriptional activator
VGTGEQAIQVSVLGVTRVCDERGERHLRPQERRILAHLALYFPCDDPTASLIDDLVAGAEDHRRRKTLQTHVHGLRQKVGATMIVSEPGGYRLDIEPRALDRWQFENGWNRAHERFELGDFASTIDHADGALATWRGEPYRDLATEEAEAERVRLSEVHDSLRDLRLLALICVSRCEEAIADASYSTRRHPLRESAWHHLMLALYRCGRRADSLRAYEHARRELAERAGLDPGPTLVHIRRLVLDDSPLLHGDARDLRAILNGEAT